MRGLCLVVSALAGAACQAPRSTGREPPRSAEPPPPTTLAPAASPALPEAPPVVAVPAPPEPAFGVVVEGRCPNLSVEFLDNATLLHHGRVQSAYFNLGGKMVSETSRLVFGRVRDDGSIDGDPALERGIPLVSQAYAGGGPGTGPLDVLSLSGHWPDHASLTLAGGGFRGFIDAFDFDWKGDHWLPHPGRSFGEAEREVRVPWLAGSSLTMPSSSSPYPEFVVVPAGAAPAPDFSALHVPKPPDCTFVESAILTRPTGELFLAGKFCGIYPAHDHPEFHYDGSHPPALQGEATVARWAPGAPATAMALPPVASHADLELHGFVEASPTTMYLYGTAGRSSDGSTEGYLAYYSGTSWSRVDTPFRGRVTPHVEPDGTLWVETAAKELYRRDPAGVWAKQPLEPVTSVAWQHERPEWVVAGGVILHHRAGGEWTRVEVPRPAFSPSAQFVVESIRFGPGKEVWAKASYEERRPEWPTPEKREALLRLGATHAPTRCDAEVGPSFSSWPPPATAACETPVVILAHVSKSAPADFTFPQTRAAVRGHTELDGAEFAEVDLDGKRLLAARVRSLEMGAHLAGLVSHAVAGAHAEVVCARPSVIRPLTFDLGVHPGTRPSSGTAGATGGP